MFSGLPTVCVIDCVITPSPVQVSSYEKEISREDFGQLLQNREETQGRYVKERCKSYLSSRIRCSWSRDLRCFGLPRGLRDHRCYRLWQGPGRCVFKFESPFAGIKKMPHSLLVNRSVFFIPREYKTLPSVQILFTKLRSHLPFCPARDDRPRFFVFILVVTVSAYHDQHFVTWRKQQKPYIIEQFVAFWFTGCSVVSGLDVVSKGEGLSCIVLVKTPTSLMPYPNVVYK